MAPLPKRRHSTARGGARELAKKRAKFLPDLVVCSACGKRKLPHQKCMFCGSTDNRAAGVSMKQDGVSMTPAAVEAKTEENTVVTE